MKINVKSRILSIAGGAAVLLSVLASGVSTAGAAEPMVLELRLGRGAATSVVVDSPIDEAGQASPFLMVTGKGPKRFILFTGHRDGLPGTKTWFPSAHEVDPAKGAIGVEAAEMTPVGEFDESVVMATIGERKNVVIRCNMQVGGLWSDVFVYDSLGNLIMQFRVDVCVNRSFGIY